jgi:Ca2+-binding EF-hand superfamily protein
MRTLLIAFAGALALSGAAWAQDITTGHLDALDTNDDGSVDATEFDAYMAAAFTSIDTNGDGYVTLVEATGYMTPEQFAAANTNGDDGLSQAEFVAAAQADFAKADVDQDGSLN